VSQNTTESGKSAAHTNSPQSTNERVFTQSGLVLEQNCWNSSNSRIDDEVLTVLSCESWREPDVVARSPLRCRHSRFFIGVARRRSARTAVSQHAGHLPVDVGGSDVSDGRRDHAADRRYETGSETNESPRTACRPIRQHIQAE